jgi:hypothetical protein
VEVPDVDVIRVELAQAGTEVAQQCILGLRAGLGCDHNLLAPDWQG